MKHSFKLGTLLLGCVLIVATCLGAEGQQPDPTIRLGGGFDGHYNAGAAGMTLAGGGVNLKITK